MKHVALKDFFGKLGKTIKDHEVQWLNEFEDKSVKCKFRTELDDIGVAGCRCIHKSSLLNYCQMDDCPLVNEGR